MLAYARVHVDMVGYARIRWDTLGYARIRSLGYARTLCHKLWHRQALPDTPARSSLLHAIRRPPPACDRFAVVCVRDASVRNSATCSEVLHCDRQLPDAVDVVASL